MVDKEYEAARNELIPEAMRHADLVAGDRPINATAKVRSSWADTWNKAYLGMMNTLAIKAGLVRAAQ